MGVRGWIVWCTCAVLHELGASAQAFPRVASRVKARWGYAASIWEHKHGGRNGRDPNRCKYVGVCVLVPIYMLQAYVAVWELRCKGVSLVAKGRGAVL